jgi:hypothetical protein
MTASTTTTAKNTPMIVIMACGLRLEFELSFTEPGLKDEVAIVVSSDRMADLFGFAAVAIAGSVCW